MVSVFCALSLAQVAVWAYASARLVGWRGWVPWLLNVDHLLCPGANCVAAFAAVFSGRLHPWSAVFMIITYVVFIFAYNGSARDPNAPGTVARPLEGTTIGLMAA